MKKSKNNLNFERIFDKANDRELKDYKINSLI